MKTYCSNIVRNICWSFNGCRQTFILYKVTFLYAIIHCTDRQTHIHKCTCIHSGVHVQTHVHTDRCICICIHTCTHKCTHTDTHRHTQTHTHIHRQTQKHTDTHTHRHTHMHTNTHITCLAAWGALKLSNFLASALSFAIFSISM